MIDSYDHQQKMSVNEHTKYRLVKAIKEVMVAKALDQITVQEIVDQANITRQTFYRHFKDKYDLVNWYFDKEALKTIRQMGISCSLEEGLIGKFQCMEKNKVFFMSAFQSSGCNSLLEYDYQLIHNFYRDVILKKDKDAFTNEIDFLLTLYSYGAVNMIVNWTSKGMLIKPEVFAKLLIESFPQKLRVLLDDLNIKKV